MNQIFETEAFSKILSGLDKSEKVWIESIKDQLKENINTGKVLVYDWFREKKFHNKRLYFIINERTSKAVLVSYGNKKEQKRAIEHIILNKDRYLKFVN